MTSKLRRTCWWGMGLLVAVGCGGGRIDWNAPENFVLREESTRRDDGMELQYWSLIDVPCQPVYDALADVEHYPDFVDGVDRVQIVSVGEGTKTVQIAQRVIGRQMSAKVVWTFHPAERRVEFKTLHSDLSFNDGSYEATASPDGKRCLVHSTFLVKEGPQAPPVGVLATGTREAFLAAARGVKQRAASAPRS